MRCLKSILIGIRWWHKVTHVESSKPVIELLTLTRPNTCYCRGNSAGLGMYNSHAFQSSSPTLALWGITQWVADAGWPKITLHGSHSSYSEEVQHSDLRPGKARNRQRYTEKCLCQRSEQTLSGVRSSSCRSTLPQAPPAQPNTNWSQMSAVQPSVCFRVWPAQPPS